MYAEVIRGNPTILSVLKHQASDDGEAWTSCHWPGRCIRTPWYSMPRGAEASSILNSHSSRCQRTCSGRRSAPRTGVEEQASVPCPFQVAANSAGEQSRLYLTASLVKHGNFWICRCACGTCCHSIIVNVTGSRTYGTQRAGVLATCLPRVAGLSPENPNLSISFPSKINLLREMEVLLGMRTTFPVDLLFTENQ